MAGRAERWPFLVWSLPGEDAWACDAVEKLCAQHRLAKVLHVGEVTVSTRHGIRASCRIANYLTEQRSRSGRRSFRLVTAHGRCAHPLVLGVASRVRALGWPCLTLADALAALPPAGARGGGSRGVGRRGGAPPYGFVWSEGYLVPHPERAEVVRWLFEMAASLSYDACVDALNAIKAPTPGRAASWGKSSVRAILANRFYAHCELIGTALFNRAQRGKQ